MHSILVYHTISEPHEASPCDEMISPERFEQQLRWLSRRRRVVPLVETLNRKESEGLVAITFDDGHRDNLTVALPILENIPQIRQQLQTLLDVGLGYIKLGQSATTLSAGEAQRIKLARELSKRATGRTIYILDEPTTGLHFADVHKLLDVLQRLVSLGNTVIVIEHNLDVIKSADHIIDLGPEGGSQGGRVVASGTPEEVARVRKSHTGQALRPLLNGHAANGHSQPNGKDAKNGGATSKESKNVTANGKATARGRRKDAA